MYKSLLSPINNALNPFPQHGDLCLVIHNSYNICQKKENSAANKAFRCIKHKVPSPLDVFPPVDKNLTLIWV